MPHEYLQAKIRVGSCKNASVNYKSSVHVFHHDDIPPWARERAKEVKEYKQSTILKQDDFPWNKQSSLSRPVYDKSSMKNHIKDRSGAMVYNFRAEELGPKLVAPIDKPSKFHFSAMLAKEAEAITSTMRKDRLQRGQFYRTKEMPTSTKLENAKQWNTSTSQNDSLRTKLFVEKGDRAKKNSMRVARELNDLDYMSPIKQSAAVTKKVREMKRNGTFDYSESLHATATNTRPEQKTPPAKNRFALEPSRKYVHHHHSGVYEFNKTEGKYMWSDTGSYVESDLGDVEKSYNPDGYNFTGPTLAPTGGFVVQKRINLIEKKKKRRKRYDLDGDVVPEAF